MKSFHFKTINEASGQELVLEALHKDDLSDRKGYDKNFLGITVALPKPAAEILKSVAENYEPGPNGKYYLDYTNFSVLFNKNKKLPFFTAVNIVGKSNEIAGIHDPRGSDSWYPDKRIQQNEDNFQFTNEDYKGSHFQKGHMVRFYDPAWGGTEEHKKIAMGDTFHYTNCCPQLGAYNAGIWNDLEDYYMSRAIFQDDKVSVFTGPIFNKAKEIHNLLVPINFWKIIIYKAENKLEAMAFLISHEIAYREMVTEELLIEKEKKVKPTLKASDINRLFNEKNLKKWVVKIELIKEKTGIDFNLSEIDINKNETRFFNVRASEFDKELKRTGHLIDHELIERNLPVEDDTEFIKNI